MALKLLIYFLLLLFFIKSATSTVNFGGMGSCFGGFNLMFTQLEENWCHLTGKYELVFEAVKWMGMKLLILNTIFHVVIFVQKGRNFHISYCTEIFCIEMEMLCQPYWINQSEVRKAKKSDKIYFRYLYMVVRFKFVQLEYEL